MTLHFYGRFVAGGSLATRPDDEKPGPASEEVLAEMQSAFEEQLGLFEQQLTKHEGPFILGCTVCHPHVCYPIAHGLLPTILMAYPTLLMMSDNIIV